MVLLSLDFECTGLDFVKDRVTEVGAALYSTGQNRVIESAGYLVQSDVLISQEITDLTGITNSAISKFGYPSEDALGTVIEMMQQADGVCGQNVKRFDKRMLESWGRRHNKTIPEKLYIDTLTDLPGVEGKKLSYMACDASFLNPFPHAALSDCYTVLKLLSMHDLDKVVERAKSPAVVVQARVTFDTNQLAKKERFRWYPDKKMWFKLMKEMDVEQFAKTAAFDVTVYRENIQEFLDL